MIRVESPWSALPQAPNIMVPRQSFETWTPVRPRGRIPLTSPLSALGTAISGVGVTVQLARMSRPSAERLPGSALKTAMRRPLSAGSSMTS